MSTKIKDYRNDDKRIYQESSDPIKLFYSYDGEATSSNSTHYININNLHSLVGGTSKVYQLGTDISRLRITISGESTGTTSSVPLYVYNKNFSAVTCYVQGWECWQGTIGYVSRSQAKICDNRILANNSFFYDINLYPTGNSSNFVCFTSHSYGGNYDSSNTAQKTCSQNWTGRIQTSASNLYALAITLPALQKGLKIRVYGET